MESVSQRILPFTPMIRCLNIKHCYGYKIKSFISWHSLCLKFCTLGWSSEEVNQVIHICVLIRFYNRLRVVKQH